MTLCGKNLSSSNRSVLDYHDIIRLKNYRYRVSFWDKFYLILHIICQLFHIQCVIQKVSSYWDKKSWKLPKAKKFKICKFSFVYNFWTYIRKKCSAFDLESKKKILKIHFLRYNTFCTFWRRKWKISGKLPTPLESWGKNTSEMLIIKFF